MGSISSKVVHIKRWKRALDAALRTTTRRTSPFFMPIDIGAARRTMPLKALFKEIIHYVTIPLYKMNKILPIR